MKLINAINEVDNLKPNMYGMQEKIKWLSRLDTKIFQEILTTHVLSDDEMAPFLPENTQEEPETEDYSAELALDLPNWKLQMWGPALVFNGYTENDTDRELIVGEPHDEMYVLWLSAQIDWNNMEFENFNASNAMFESVYQDFKRAFNRTHRPYGATKLYF